MLESLFIALEAHHAELNHHRRYEVSVGQDLLGDWVVTVRYGRSGRPLQTLTFGHHDVDHAKRALHERLIRRRSAPRRIGCGYRLVDFAARQETGQPDWMTLSELQRLVSEYGRPVASAN